MDLSIVLDDIKLNIRACGIMIHDNKLLVHNNTNESHVALVGGRVKIGENSEDTLKREIFEEMGKEIEILEFVSTIENFFEADDMPYHEIMFVYKIDFKDENDKKITETIKNVEGQDELKYDWIDLDKIDEYPLKPDILKELLINNKYLGHGINDERKN